MRDKLYESLQLRSTYVARIMVSRYERKVFWFHVHELPHPQLATEGRGKLKKPLKQRISITLYLSRLLQPWNTTHTAGNSRWRVQNTMIFERNVIGRQILCLKIH